MPAPKRMDSYPVYLINIVDTILAHPTEQICLELPAESACKPLQVQFNGFINALESQGPEHLRKTCRAVTTSVKVAGDVLPRGGNAGGPCVVFFHRDHSHAVELLALQVSQEVSRIEHE